MYSILLSMGEKKEEKRKTKKKGNKERETNKNSKHF